MSGSHGRGSKGSANTVVRKRDPLNVELGNITKYDASCSSESATGWHYLPTEKRFGRQNNKLSLQPIAFQGLLTTWMETAYSTMS